MCARLLPHMVEAPRECRQHIIAPRKVQVLEFVFVIVAVGFRLAGTGIDFFGREFQNVAKRCSGILVGFRSLPEAGIKGARFVGAELSNRDDEVLFERAVVIRGGRNNGHVFEDGSFDGILDIVLQDDVVLEDMLDRSDDVLGFRLRKLSWIGGFEDGTKLLEFRNGHKLLRVLLRFGSGRGGAFGGAINLSLLGACSWCFEGGSRGSEFLGSLFGESLFVRDNRDGAHVEGFGEGRFVVGCDVHDELVFEGS